MAPDTRERLRVLAFDRGGLLAVVALVIYVILAPEHIVDGDNAEFSTLAITGGTAHPTGYPLYLLWLRAWGWLPGSPAHAAALATAILGALMVLALHAACRAWGARPVGASAAVALYAGAPIILRITTTAEVFALNGLVVAVILWLSAAAGPVRGNRRVAALAAVAALGIANHMTCTLVAPVGIFGIIRGIREAERPSLAVTLGLAAFALGLSPYLYLFLTPETPLSWGKVASADDLYGMITRRDYGGAGSFLPTEVEVSPLRQLAALGMTLGRTWWWVPLAAGLVALVRGVARPSTDTRWGWLCLAASFVIAGPLLVMRFNIEPVGLGLYVSQRFYVLPALLLAIPIAVGLRPLDELVAKSRLGTRRACAGIAVLGCATSVALSLPWIARMHTPAVERYASNILATLPPNAVLVIGQDDEYFGTAYVQWALGRRQDVVVYAPQLVAMPWYAARVARRGIVAPPGEGPELVRLVDKLLREGKPVFVEKRRGEIISTFTTYPYGTLMKVLPRGAPTPPIDDVVAENKALYARFETGYPLPGPDDEFATAVHHRYADTWLTLGRKLEQAGRREDAQWAYAAARAIGPQP